MLGRIARLGRTFVTGGRPNLSSTNLRAGEPVEPTVSTAIAAHAAIMSGQSNGKTPLDVATVASGCFWGTEHIYREYYGKGKGLLDAKVGFIGGKESSKDPSYEEVCTGRTGHAEATQIRFDPAKVSYAELVEFFYRSHDPTQLNAQGNDRGSQYRSALFPHDDEQLSIVKKVTQEVQDKVCAQVLLAGQKSATARQGRDTRASIADHPQRRLLLPLHLTPFPCSTSRQRARRSSRQSKSGLQAPSSSLKTTTRNICTATRGATSARHTISGGR